MTSIISSLPIWFTMLIIAALVIAVIYRLVRYGIKIKTPIIEIDATEESNDAGKMEEAKGEQKESSSPQGDGAQKKAPELDTVP